MAREWYYQQQGKEAGPFTPQELRGKVRATELYNRIDDPKGRRGPLGSGHESTGTLRHAAETADRPDAATTALPPRVLAACWYCGNLRRIAEAHCGSCGASWQKEVPQVVVAQQQATKGLDARAKIGLIFLMLAGLGVVAHGLMTEMPIAILIVGGGILLVVVSFLGLVLPWMTRLQARQSKAGPSLDEAGTVPYAADAASDSNVLVTTTEGLSAGFGYVGYIALWVTIGVAAASVAMFVLLVAAVILLFAVCLAAAGG